MARVHCATSAHLIGGKLSVDLKGWQQLGDAVSADGEHRWPVDKDGTADDGDQETSEKTYHCP